jgi:hypothetical protein
MRRNFLCLVFLLSLLLCPRASRGQPQNGYYVYDGKAIQVVREDPAQAKYTRWQVWLYGFPVNIQNHTAGLPYSRWGVIRGWSAEGVVKRLEIYRGFEKAYLSFFGAGSWVWHTFSNSIGPIALTGQAIPNESLASPFELSDLDYRLDRLVEAVQPSLENNQREGPGSPVSSVREYFEQVANVMVKGSELYSHLARPNPQPRFIDGEMAAIRTAVAQAERNVPKITSVLPSVKLPTSSAWMSHTHRAGSDGVIEETVVETGSGVMIQESWAGGDNRMAGTVVLTLVPFQNISQVEISPPIVRGGDRWSVLVHSDRSGFQEILSSPERQTSTRTLRAVNYTTTKTLEYLAFSNPGEARDAYAYFLYHKQLGR